MSAIKEWYIGAEGIMLTTIKEKVEILLFGNDCGVEIWLDDDNNFNPDAIENFDSYGFDYDLYNIAIESLLKATNVKLTVDDFIKKLASDSLSANIQDIYMICKNYIVNNFTLKE